MLKPHIVVEILGEPRKMRIKLDHLLNEYWSIPVKLKSPKGKIYQSAVTFETLEKAVALKIGDEFLR